MFSAHERAGGDEHELVSVAPDLPDPLERAHVEPELFDLTADPEELTNLAGDPAHRATRDALAPLHRELADTQRQARERRRS